MEDFTEILLELAKKVIAITKEAKKNNEIKFSKTPLIMDIITEFNYDKKTGGISYSSTGGEIYREEPDVFYLHDLLEKKIKNIPGFSKANKIIAEITNESENQANFWLSNFITSIMKKSIDGISDSKLTLSTISFSREIEDIAINWHPVVWLDGLIVLDKEIQIKKNLIIKQPTKDDISRTRRLMYPYSNGMIRDLPTAILLSSFKAKSQGDAQREIQKLLITLRLFKVGSIINISTKWKSDGVMWIGGGTTTGSGNISPFYKYSISKNDIPKIKEFLDKIEKLIPQEIIFPSSSEVDHTVIAIQRYQDALLKPEINESRLSFAIMSLEAIYLKDNERQELEHRLGQRVAMTLAKYGHNSLEIYNKLKSSYEIRSSFVHGSPISKERQAEAAELASSIIEYSRLSIVIQLQLKGITEKDKFLNLVDNSLLNQNASDKLDALLQKHIIIS